MRIAKINMALSFPPAGNYKHTSPPPPPFQKREKNCSFGQPQKLFAFSLGGIGGHPT